MRMAIVLLVLPVAVFGSRALLPRGLSAAIGVAVATVVAAHPQGLRRLAGGFGWPVPGPMIVGLCLAGAIVPAFLLTGAD
ncbi:MAG: hypothetical protein ACK4OP_15300 [Gemmobacter sp.]